MKAACVLVLALAVQAASAAKFKLLHFNDFHSKIEPNNEYHKSCEKDQLKKGMCSGGLAKAKTFIQRERAKGQPLLVLNAGDDFVGSAWDHYYKGKATAHFMNQLGLDAMTLGNHEFDYGPDVLLEYVKQLKFPVLSANMQANGHALGHYVKPYITKYVDGMLVGICGITTTATNWYSHPWQVRFTDEGKAAAKCAKEVREKKGAKIVILLSHSGFNADRYHAKHIPGIDVVVGGHSHAFLWNWDWGPPPAITYKWGHARRDTVWAQYPVMEWSHVEKKKIPVVQAGWGGRYIGMAHVHFNNDGQLVSFWGRPYLLGGAGSDNPVTPDRSMDKDIQSWRYW